MAADWTKIKTEYITTQISYRALEKKYGINYKVIADRGKKEGWSQLRSQHQDKTLTRSVERICEKKAEQASRLDDAADMLLDKVLQFMMASEDMMVNTQAMKHISGVLKDIKEIKGVKSDADLREQEARIAKLRKEVERDEDDKDRTVTVTITGGDESWRR
jgi:hypothetical protein